MLHAHIYRKSVSVSVSFGQLHKQKSSSFTVEVEGLTVVVGYPVVTVGDIVQVPARRQESPVTLGCHIEHFLLPAVLPHVNNRVRLHLQDTSNTSNTEGLAHRGEAELVLALGIHTGVGVHPMMY